MRILISAGIFRYIFQHIGTDLITIKNILLVGMGGFAGSACRFIISVLMMNIKTAGCFPWGTLTVNSAGSLLIGFFMAAMAGHPAYLLLVSGFCGGFTTFSTFSAEVLGMLKNGEYAQSTAYISASVVLCVLMVWAGMYLGQKIIK